MKAVMTKRRAQIIEMLQNRKMTVKEIADDFLTEPAEIVYDLQFVKELASPKRLKFTAAVCKDCGFSNKDRTKGKSPQRCPKCKNHHFNPVKYFIE